MKNFAHVNATSLAGAVGLLEQKGNSRVIAGGTDLITEMRLGIVAPDRLINLKTIPGMNEILFEEKPGFRLGALATLDEIARNKAVQEHYPILVQAISQAASPQLRNRGTLAGNLSQDSRCWYYRGQFQCWLKGGTICYAKDGENAHHAILGGGPCYTVHPSDPAPALIALKAQIHIHGPHGERSLPLERFFQVPREDSRRLTILEPTEIITQIDIPASPPQSIGTYLKAMDRKVWSFALVSLAAQLTWNGDRISESRLVFGGVAPRPWRRQDIEALLQDQKLDDSTIDRAVRLLRNGEQPLAHNGYKVALSQGLLKEALNFLSRQGHFIYAA